MKNNLENLNFFPAVSIVMTTNCRMKCKFCCAEELKKNTSADKKNLLKIIDILHDNDVKRILFSGGEPLLSPFLEDCLKKSYEYKIQNTLMTSDGDLLSKISFPKEYVSVIWLSIHGINEEHDAITSVKNSFANLENALINKKNDYPLSVWCVLTPALKNKINSYIDWCINHEVKTVYFTNLSTSGLGDNYIASNGRIENNDFQEVLDKLRIEYKDKINILGRGFEANAECIVIHGNGDVFVTPYFGSENNEKCFGNILKDNPEKVFQNFKNDLKIWNDYLERLSKSSLFKESK
ncbi:MAG: radical SAM protein [Bacilli bacterium]